MDERQWRNWRDTAEERGRETGESWLEDRSETEESCESDRRDKKETADVEIGKEREREMR